MACCCTRGWFRWVGGLAQDVHSATRAWYREVLGAVRTRCSGATQRAGFPIGAERLTSGAAIQSNRAISSHSRVDCQRLSICESRFLRRAGGDNNLLARAAAAMAGASAVPARGGGSDAWQRGGAACVYRLQRLGWHLAGGGLL